MEPATLFFVTYFTVSIWTMFGIVRYFQTLDKRPLEE
jgi:hypothetical protein